MVEHIVVIKLKPATSNEQKRELVMRLLALKEKIPGILGVTAGINSVADEKRTLGFGIGLIVRFESEEAYNKYISHPAHLQVMDYMRELVESRAMIDFDV